MACASPTDVGVAQYLRSFSKRNSHVIPIPPPLCPPPPECTRDCGSDGMKALQMDTCSCVCVQAIPAPCVTPTPIPRTPTKKSPKKGPKKRRGRSKSPKVYSGCPELTPKGRNFKKVKKSRKARRTHTHSHTHRSRSHSRNDTTTSTTSTSLCPAGQQLNDNTCECMIM